MDKSGAAKQWWHFQGSFWLHLTFVRLTHPMLSSGRTLPHGSSSTSTWLGLLTSWLLCRVRVNHFIVTHGWSISPKGFSLVSHVPRRHMKGEEKRFGSFEALWSWICLHCLHLMFFFFPRNFLLRPPRVYLLKSCLDVPYCRWLFEM